MHVLVCYDVETVSREGRRRLRRVAKTCESHGQRAQKSVFECHMEESLFRTFENKLLKIIDVKCDSLRIYFLDEDTIRKTRNYGLLNLRPYDQAIVL